MHTIAPNISSKRITLIHDGQLSKVIMLMFTRHEASEGSYQMGPHVFPHYSLENLELLIDGQTVGRTRRLVMDYPNHRYTRAYTTTMCSMGRMFTDHSCGISYEDFAQGNAVYVFDVTNDYTGGKNAELIKSGTVTVEVKFTNALVHTVYLTYCGEFDDQTNLDLHAKPTQLGAA